MKAYIKLHTTDNIHSHRIYAYISTTFKHVYACE